MKFWIVDLEKEIFLENALVTPFHFLGVLGYVVMWIFLVFFITTRASPYIDKSVIGIVCGGFYLLMFVTFYCKLSQKLTLNSIVPVSIDDNDNEESLPSIHKITIPDETDNPKPKTARSRGSAADTHPNLLVWNTVSGIFWTIFTLNTHGFLYGYIVSCTVPVEYHIIFMANIAFPVTLTLICFTSISLNILYNLWVDLDFAVDFLIKSQYKRMLFSVYVRLGWLFLFVAFISALFSSFCGMIRGDYNSTIIFILWLCLIAVALVLKLVKKYLKQVLKLFAPKNN